MRHPRTVGDDGQGVDMMSLARQAGWPEARWEVLLAAVREWREVADMTDKQQGWQVLPDFPLSDEAVRLGATWLMMRKRCLQKTASER
jgi:hypothetical protein